MAKVKVVNTNLDQNLNGSNFNNTVSETIFQFGNFLLTSNFSGRVPVDYSNKLSSFVEPITLETLGLNETQSTLINDKTTNTVLNFDKSNLNTFIRFGSAYEFLRVSVENIIMKYPASLFVNSNKIVGGNETYYDFVFDEIRDISTFKIHAGAIVNNFNLVFNLGNDSKPDNQEIKNLNLSYHKYVIWSKFDANNNYPILEFSGDTLGIPYIKVKCQGNPFKFNNYSSGYVDFHIKPNNIIFEEFRLNTLPYEQYMLSQRDGIFGFKFNISDPTLLDDGTITYTNNLMLWTTTDGYNIDINNSAYERFLNILLTVGAKYDTIKTDLIARFLIPSSLKNYDLSDDNKMNKLLRIYGWEFDRIREFVDSLVYINTLTYNKKNNIPDQLISNLAKTLGWNYFNLVNEEQLADSFFSIDNSERNLNTDLLPAEVNIELWRRILINTNYFWKTKGTREAIKSMFLLIGIPEPFINITEYVYTVEGKIDPKQVILSQSDFPSNSLPYDNFGYPKAPLETKDFYFQINGDNDSGQAYLNAFRLAGFNLNQTVDNKKSWIETGSTTRIHYSTPQYYQEDSKLIINTKEVDVSLDTARGIEYDVYDYVKNYDFPANSSGYTLPYKYVNLSLGVGASQNTFTLPSQFNKAEGDIEVRFNGILLNAPKESDYDGSSGGTYSETTEADYEITGNTITLNNGIYAVNSNGRRDVLQVTYIYSGETINPISGISIQYMVTRIKPNLAGTIIPLPNDASGDVQVTINGVALTKGTSQFVGDYIIDPYNSSQIIIQNQDVISYLNTMNQTTTNAYVQVAYLNVVGSSTISARSEILRIDSFNTSKIYYNSSANKYVYKLNYKINNARDVKILIDGIALEPQTDYNININNPYEIYLPKTLKYGNVISAYYLVGGGEYFNPVVGDNFGVGDISKLSFLEFVELVQRKLINVKNRKTITDFKGGWYPTLLRIYIKYLERNKLSENNILHSNGYTFRNLYPFLTKYNSFFQNFVEQLLSATIIQRKSGLMIRNSIFTRQKFAYKRGVYMGYIVNMQPNNATVFRFDNQLQHFGDDGTLYVKRPLSQAADWKSDYVCVDDLCEDFIVTDVTVTYPTTTTTTTQYPFTSIMILDENYSTLSPIDYGSQVGYQAVSESTINFNPAIPPGYVVTVGFEFLSKLYITGSSNNQVMSSIYFNRNEDNLLNQTHENVTEGNYEFSDYVEVTIQAGDGLVLLLETTSLKSTVSGNHTQSSISVLPTIISVTPNGNVNTIIPPILNVNTPTT